MEALVVFFFDDVFAVALAAAGFGCVEARRSRRTVGVACCAFFVVVGFLDTRGSAAFLGLLAAEPCEARLLGFDDAGSTGSRFAARRGVPRALPVPVL